MSHRILFVTSEAYPLVKTGGLADYTGGLVKALARQGHEVRVLLPGYPEALEVLSECVEHRVELGDPFGAGPTALVLAPMPGVAARVWLIDCPKLYGRAGGIYQDPNGDDWPDNAQRFGLLARVAAWLALGGGPLPWRPDIVHLNEWQTGPAAALLAHERAAPPTLFTIHNMAFQGLFDADVLSFLELPKSVFDAGGVEFFGKVSYLKAGIRYADRIATVSEAYAQEILTPEFGFGLEGLLNERASDLVGILNGADYEEWSPQTDRHLAAPFGPRNFATRKPLCTRALRQRFGLAELHGDVPVLAFISRITHQKMADVLVQALPQILERGAQVVVLGRGDHAMEAALVELAQQFPEALAVHIGYNEELAHQVLAGADILLAPARFEPCGLTQMYGLRYGTVPIVTNVGGLRETVVDPRSPGDEDRMATGFVFEERSLEGLLDVVDRALAAYRTKPDWREIQRAGLAQDFSWKASAMKYEQLYADLVRLRPAPKAALEGRQSAATNRRVVTRETEALAG
jgi:starch synthase